MAQDRDTPFKAFSCPLTGKWLPAEDPLLLGEGDFSVLSNMRYTQKGIRGIRGQTKYNTSELDSTFKVIRSAYHFTKEYPEADESHVLVQAFNTAENNSKLYGYATAIGSTTASAPELLHPPDVETPSIMRPGVARMTYAPYGTVVVCNGTETLVWGGNGMKVGRYLDKGEASQVKYDGKYYKCIKQNVNKLPTDTEFWEEIDIDGAVAWNSALTYTPKFNYDYTVQINNSLSDDINVIPIKTQIVDNNDISYLYIGSIIPICGITFYMHVPNTAIYANAYPWVQYWGGSTSIVPMRAPVHEGDPPEPVTPGEYDDGWSTIGHIDTTIANGATLGNMEGSYDFADTTGLARPAIINNVYLYWYRVFINGSVSPTTKIKQITLKTKFQEISDLWDGEDRTVVSYFRQEKTGDPAVSRLYDETINVSKDSYNVVAGTEPAEYDPSSISEIFTTSAGNYLYFGFVERAAGILLKLLPSRTNINDSEMTIEYWSGLQWETVGAVNDETSEYGKTLATSGWITWTPPAESSENKTNISAGGNKIKPPAPPAFNSPGEGSGYWDAGISDNPVWIPTPSGGISVTAEGGIAYGGSDPTSNMYYYRMSFSADLDAPETKKVAIYYAASIPAPKTVKALRYPCMWGDRLVLASEVSGNANILTVLPPSTVNVFNGSDYLRLPIGDDSPINAMGSIINRFGADLSNLLVLCKEKETWIAALSQSDSGSRLSALPVSRNVGCPAPGTFKICDLGLNIAPGVNRHVIIWLSNAGVAMYDQASVTMIHGDIQNYFDPWRDEYIDYTKAEKFYADFDVRNQEYHLYVYSNGSWIELVFSLNYKKWFKADRGVKALNGSIHAVDTSGRSENYGFTSGGYLYRLENGQTFDGQSITYHFRLGAKALAGLMTQTIIRKIRLLAVSKNAAANKVVTISDYIDTSLTPKVASTLSVKDSTSRVAFYDNRGIRSVDWGPGLTHELDFTITTSDEDVGFEPLIVGGSYKAAREEMGG